MYIVYTCIYASSVKCTTYMYLQYIRECGSVMFIRIAYSGIENNCSSASSWDIRSKFSMNVYMAIRYM